MYDIGQNAAIGLANGLTAQSGAVASAAAALARIVSATVRGALMIHSPSRVMEGLGEFTGEGFAIGIEESVGRVERAVGAMLGAVSGGRIETPAAGAYAYGNGGQIRPVIVMDKQVVGEMIAPVVDGWMGAEIIERR